MDKLMSSQDPQEGYTGNSVATAGIAGIGLPLPDKSKVKN